MHYTLDNEVQYVKKMVSQLSWFKRNGYIIRLPKGIGDDSNERNIYIRTSREFTNGKKKFDVIRFALRKEIKKHQKTLDTFFLNFDYPLPKNIHVYFTIYGPGGSYYPPNKIIVVLKDSIEWILQTIVHESIHLIIEKPFIKKNNIPHWEKEALVDRLCMDNLLKDFNLHYQKQPQTISTSATSALIMKIRFKKPSLARKQERARGVLSVPR